MYVCILSTCLTLGHQVHVLQLQDRTDPCSSHDHTNYSVRIAEEQYVQHPSHQATIFFLHWRDAICGALRSFVSVSIVHPRDQDQGTYIFFFFFITSVFHLERKMLSVA